jgi:hypothetical protein
MSIRVYTGYVYHGIVIGKAGVHTPRLASVKFTATEKVVKPIFGSGVWTQEPAHRFAGESTINFLSNEDTSGLAPRFFIKLCRLKKLTIL